MFVRESIKIGDKVVTLETGRVAKQAGGSILATCGETVVLVTCCGNIEGKPGQSFLPLSVEYAEKMYAGGKIPGGFFKREGKLRDHEVLVARLIDRPCRPLFPEGWFGDIQVVAQVMSYDKENSPDVIAMTAASAAIHLSAIPWAGPIAGVRVGRIDGKFVANPTMEEQERSDMDLIIAASRDAITMVEGEADEISEADMVAALEFGKAAVQDAITLIERMRVEAGKTKWPFTPPTRDPRIDQRVRDVALAGVREACNTREKFARGSKFKSTGKQMMATLAAEFPGQEKHLDAAYEDLKYETMRNQVVYDKARVDGRDLVTVRPISIEVGMLPRTHGSALFTRGETQAIVVATLGTKQDEQRIDGLTIEYWKQFMLHYNFPPFSVGEIKPMRGPGRREIGHGNLAERALAKLLPDHEKFPYTIRIVSEITESNGSSSMASVCGGSLAMMDAGVPMNAPVAGVAMGLIMQGRDYAVLTDILGDEDHLGDMDFKVCGTSKGITAIQMDIKISGLSFDIMREALSQARDGRLHILGKMNEIISTGRSEMSKYAPRITQIRVKPDQIRSIIGPGGKMIKAIVDQTGAKIDVSDDGTVSISSADPESVKKAIAIIESITTVPEVGQKFKGIVRRVERYGVFVELAPGCDGLLHVTDMDWGFVENVEDIAKLGDEIEVVVKEIDRDGKIKVSRKMLLERPEGMEDRGGPRGDRGDRGDRGPRFDRGPRHGRDDGPRHGRDDGPRHGRDDGPRHVRDEAPRHVRDEAPRHAPVEADVEVVRSKERDEEREKRRVERDARRVERERERGHADVIAPVEAPRRPRDEDVIEPPRKVRDEVRDEPRRARDERKPVRDEVRDERPAPRRDERPARVRDDVLDDVRKPVREERPARVRDDLRDDRPVPRRDDARADRKPARDDDRPARVRDDLRDDRPARVRDDRPARVREDVLEDVRKPVRDDDRPRRYRDEPRDEVRRDVRDEPRRTRDDLRDEPRRTRDEARRGRDEELDVPRTSARSGRRDELDERPAPRRDDDRVARRSRDDERLDDRSVRPATPRTSRDDDRSPRGGAPRPPRDDDRPARGRDDDRPAPRRDDRPAPRRDDDRPARGRDDDRSPRGRDDDRPAPRRDDRPAPRRDDDRGGRSRAVRDSDPPPRDPRRDDRDDDRSRRDVRPTREPLRLAPRDTGRRGRDRDDD